MKGTVPLPLLNISGMTLGKCQPLAGSYLQVVIAGSIAFALEHSVSSSVAARNMENPNMMARSQMGSTT